MAKQTITMDDLLGDVQYKQLATGEVVEATVLNVKKHEIWLDLGLNGIGMVPRREIGFGQQFVTAPGSRVMEWFEHVDWGTH